jgi:tetratricopeptide (TPR) repeat protein
MFWCLRRALAAVALAFSSILVPQSADAAGPSPEAVAADALYGSAKEALARGETRRACELFEESLRVQPAAGTLLNLGDCHFHLGQWMAALDYFRQGRKRLVPGDYRISFADKRITDLESAVPHLELSLSGAPPSDVRVFLDEREIPLDSLGAALAVDPGTHVFIVRAPEHRDERIEVTVKERETKTLALAAGPLLPGGRGGSLDVPPGAAAASASNRGRAQRIWGFAFGGLGAVALGTGAVLGLTAHATYDDALSHCPTGPASCTLPGVQGGHNAELEATASTIAFVAGGAAIATGAVLVFTASKSNKVAVTSQILVGSAFVSVRGLW